MNQQYFAKPINRGRLLKFVIMVLCCWVGLAPLPTFLGAADRAESGVPLVLVFVNSGDKLPSDRESGIHQTIRNEIEKELNIQELHVSDTISIAEDQRNKLADRLAKKTIDAAILLEVSLSGTLKKKMTMMYQGIATIELELVVCRFENGAVEKTDQSLTLKKQVLPIGRWSAEREKQIVFYEKVAGKLLKRWPKAATTEFASRLGQYKADFDRAYGDDIPELLADAKKAPVDDTKWLLTIGIEKYRNSDDIAFAERSARLFSEVAQKALGIKQENSYVLINEDATSGGIKNNLRLMLNEVKEGDTIYFYYNGHGIPVKNRNGEAEPYLLPQDVMAEYIQDESLFKLRNFYKKLTDSKAGKVIAIVDSCFSGATDDKSVIKGVAAGRLAPKKIRIDKKKMVVLAAGQKTQYSNMYSKKKHRLFTYFIMRSLLKGRKEARELLDDIGYKVEEASRAMGPLKKQQPTLEGNEGIRL